MTDRRPPLARLRHALGVTMRYVPFSVWFAGQMAVANWQVARDLLTRGKDTTPGVAAVPLRCRTRVEVAVLSNLITLTPGTVTLEVDRLGHALYVLDIYGPPTAIELREQIQDLETRILRVLRGTEPPPPPVEVRRGGPGRAPEGGPIA